MVCLGRPFITSNFLKAVFQKFAWSILKYLDPYDVVVDDETRLQRKHKVWKLGWFNYFDDKTLCINQLPNGAAIT